jgi:hypothetical protein
MIWKLLHIQRDYNVEMLFLIMGVEAYKKEKRELGRWELEKAKPHT